MMETTTTIFDDMVRAYEAIPVDERKRYFFRVSYRELRQLPSDAIKRIGEILIVQSRELETPFELCLLTQGMIDHCIRAIRQDLIINLERVLEDQPDEFEDTLDYYRDYRKVILRIAQIAGLTSE